MVGNKGTPAATGSLRRGTGPPTKKRPGRAGAFKSAAKALRALDYLLLVAGAEDMAFLA